jgi:hypothetical protein
MSDPGDQAEIERLENELDEAREAIITLTKIIQKLMENENPFGSKNYWN